MDGQHPEIVSRVWNAIELGPTAAYIEIDGFAITGNDQNVSRESALRRGSADKPAPDPTYDGNCISIDGRKGTATSRPHHIRILNNVIGNCGGGGISTIQADYVTISANTVYNSAWYSIYGCSGISTLEDWNSDDSTATKMVITENRVFDNRELVPWSARGKITDGEGIIVDTSRSPTLGNYRGRTLIADNVLYRNESAAIEVFRSDHVDILNNSTNLDLQVPQVSGNGELNLNDATDVKAANNIFVSAANYNLSSSIRTSRATVHCRPTSFTAGRANHAEARAETLCMPIHNTSAPPICDSQRAPRPPVLRKIDGQCLRILWTLPPQRRSVGPRGIST
jgi:hypothetical protein